jgi:ATP-dependent Clp protease, protease subunit
MTPQIKMRLANKGKGDFRAEENTIWLYDAIASDEDEAMWFGGVSPRDFISALSRTTGPVTLRINSPGGSVFGAQAMVAAMRDHAYPVTARIDSLAASAASVIAAECAECEMVPGSMMMIHKAWGLAVGNSEDMLATAELLEKIDGQIAAAYARRAGDDKDWAAMMAAETWFTAEEALGVGLVSRVADENKQRPANCWDLSAFAKAPVIEPAPEPVNDDAPAHDLRAMRARQLAARLAASAI